MKIELNYDTDEISVDGELLGIPLSKAKVDLVFSGDDGAGVARMFVPFDNVVIVPKTPIVAPVRQPNLIDQLSPSDAFEVEMERIRRGGPHGPR